MFRLIALAIVGGILIYTALWQPVVLFIWKNPLLTWLPLLVLIAVTQVVRRVRALSGPAPDQRTANEKLAEAVGSPSEQVAAAEAEGTSPAKRLARPRAAMPGAGGWGVLAGLAVLLLGVYLTWISPPAAGLDEIDYEVVDTLPLRTQPRLLPRAGVRDDPNFADADEIHLVRDPRTGELLWTGEWQSSWLEGASGGTSVKSLDDLVAQSEILFAGFDHSVGGFGPGTLRWKARVSHPFSATQYPVIVPTGEREAFAMAPYVGYKGFPIRYPYLKGVLVYHQDGTVEDLTPEEAIERPELVQTGRIFPEAVARSQAEALARSDEFEGKIVDGEGNRQPFLTSIDPTRTAWVTIINEKGREGGIRAIVLADSSTGETRVWVPPADEHLISTEDVIRRARSLPLRWEETRCCDSEGHSYTVTLREVVEPRLAFKDGEPYYLVTIVPTGDLALPRAVEYTLLIDAHSGEELDRFEHVGLGPGEDARLQAFFGADPGGGRGGG